MCHRGPWIVNLLVLQGSLIYPCPLAHLGRPKCKIFRQLHSKTNSLGVASRSVTVRCHEFKCALMAYFVERVA